MTRKKAVVLFLVVVLVLTIAVAPLIAADVQSGLVASNVQGGVSFHTTGSSAMPNTIGCDGCYGGGGPG